MTVKQRGPVQYLGSTVRALFPAVTASGIPKDAACSYIRTASPVPVPGWVSRVSAGPFGRGW
ncbi:hypothetical protein IAG44_00710 [Streptomyces roseirectus]|uniref:Uncharacterized protein n=1 Tax=Streptomyces roseirectus TaxID=2768066 RepID=A0A7H0ITV3_9ACTN|nr:hypothetical protein [Streptomyces roseirectus]QNP76219.1 hypothetical protein IAG44_00710 [Streptomyces roseirectus]